MFLYKKDDWLIFVVDELEAKINYRKNYAYVIIETVSLQRILKWFSSEWKQRNSICISCLHLVSSVQLLHIFIFNEFAESSLKINYLYFHAHF